MLIAPNNTSIGVMGFVRRLAESVPTTGSTSIFPCSPALGDDGFADGFALRPAISTDPMGKYCRERKSCRAFSSMLAMSGSGCDFLDMRFSWPTGEECQEPAVARRLTLSAVASKREIALLPKEAVPAFGIVMQ